MKTKNLLPKSWAVYQEKQYDSKFRCVVDYLRDNHKSILTGSSSRTYYGVHKDGCYHSSTDGSRFDVILTLDEFKQLSNIKMTITSSSLFPIY